jgi:hypothetical protein
LPAKRWVCAEKYLLAWIGRVWINGKEVPVPFSRYARIEAGAYYMDGTEAGLHGDDNTVVLLLRKTDAIKGTSWLK